MHDSGHVNDLVQELELWDLDGLPNSDIVGTTSPKDNREVQNFVEELNPEHLQRKSEVDLHTLDVKGPILAGKR